MLDKVMLVNKNQAYLIFDDRSPVGIYSDVDVVPLLMWFLGCPRAHLTLDNQQNVVGIELRPFNDEATIKIELKDVA